VAIATKLANAKVALALADATLHDGLNKVLEGALGNLEPSDVMATRQDWHQNLTSAGWP